MLDQEMAGYLLLGLTTLALLFWGLVFHLIRNSRLSLGTAPAEESWGLEGSEGTHAPPDLSGSEEVPGEAQDLVRKAIALLVRGSVFGPIRIVETQPDWIHFERIASKDPMPQNMAMFTGGELEFSQVRPGVTRVDWFILGNESRKRLWHASLMNYAGLVVIAIGALVIYRFCVLSKIEAIRWQTFQMLQTVHILWPPLLIRGLAKKGIDGARSLFVAFVSNVPHVPE